MDDYEGAPQTANGNESQDHSIPDNAFLIIGGTKSVSLNQSLMKIGRSHDNAVIVDDPRVSRHHAELRVIGDHFVLFDLRSSGGTFVNGMRVEQALLYPGDVISLAGVMIHFIRGVPRPNEGLKKTSDLFPGPGEHGTAIFNSSFFNKRDKGKSE